MYSKKKTQETLKNFATREGWMPTPHTIEEVDEFKMYIDSITTIESNSTSSYVSLSKLLSSARQKEVFKWIENEQAMCSADYSYWESRYAYVKSETGEVFRFKNRTAQTILDSVIADLDENGLSKELLVLGSRQTGTSTKFLLMGSHKAIFTPNSGVLLASASILKSEIMGEIIDSVYNRSPWWLVPSRLPKKRFDNGSSIFILSSSNSKIEQGYTPNFVYIADAGEFPRPVRTFEEGLFRTVQSSANGLMVIHGGMGSHGGSWLRGLWNYSKEYYPKGMAKFMPIFLPWYVSSDVYPTKEWIVRFPVPEKWSPAKETKDHVLRCELYARSTPILTKYLGKGWKMPIEQKWFWEYSYNYAKAIHALDSFLSRMAADDEDILDNIEVGEDKIDLDNVFPKANNTQNNILSGRK